CTGGVVGSLTAGELCATPSGIAACSIGGGTPPFVCGDQITITSLLGHTCDTDAPDYDTCTYDTIQIGAQCWLAGNMNVGTYVISSEDQDDDSNLEKYCYNNDTDNCLSYGALYQWDETMQYSTSEGAQGICPTGWHIPSDAEQNTLDQYLTDLPNSCDPARIDTGYIDGECANAGTKLAIGGSSGFNWPIAGFYKSSFQSLSAWTYIWSSSISGQSAYFRGLLAGQPTVYRVYDNWNVGVSVRCLQD
ncbi:MAG TPA: fibrobacter succinogenes major paralogous domain-containing protein, partial [bacterium]|nr:fibrobacter succinogenes major paralogous domain-containing protein [bacterium]